MLKITEITNELCAERFQRYFRMFVGPRCRYSVEEFAMLTGIDKRTIDSWRTNSYFPQGAHLFKCISLLGADFCGPIFGLIGMVVSFPDQVEVVNPIEIISDSAEYAHIMADAFQDHRKKEDVIDKGARLASKIITYNQFCVGNA